MWDKRCVFVYGTVPNTRPNKGGAACAWGLLGRKEGETKWLGDYRLGWATAEERKATAEVNRGSFHLK